MKTVKVNQIANGSVQCKRFRLENGRTWYTAAFKDDTKDRRRVRVSRTDYGTEVRRYLNPHTVVVIE